jgi:alternate F1F0 ATPase F1 subunit epsilon
MIAMACGLVGCPKEGMPPEVSGNMRLKAVSFEALDGYRTLLPKHVDFVSILAAGIICYETEGGAMKYAACHQGVVVKKGKDVNISAQGIVKADTLEELRQMIELDFKQNEEHRKELNTAMARLEIGLVRGFQQLKGGGYGGL